MVKSSNQLYLERILNYSGVKHRKVNQYKYQIWYGEQSWFLWPKSERYQEVTDKTYPSDMYFCELKVFYWKIIRGNLELPVNFGKIWTNQDENSLFDMIEFGYSVNQISQELDRHPNSVLDKLRSFLDLPHLNGSKVNYLLDISIIDILIEMNSQATKTKL